VDVVLVHSPDRLARKFAYQALLLEEFARAGVRAEFVKGACGDTPEDQLLIQFQGMFAEYEKAQLMERYRRGKAYRAAPGRSTCSAAPRAATGRSARPRNPVPGTRSSLMRRCWSRRCSAATPTTAPPSPRSRGG
jgi:DNA invertase Pin-like site-specific DNA recombinase